MINKINKYNTKIWSLCVWLTIRIDHTFQKLRFSSLYKVISSDGLRPSCSLRYCHIGTNWCWLYIGNSRQHTHIIGFSGLEYPCEMSGLVHVRGGWKSSWFVLLLCWCYTTKGHPCFDSICVMISSLFVKASVFMK